MRSSLFALVACFCLWILLLPAASASPDFRIEMEEDGWAFSSVQGNVEGELIDEESQAGERYLWSLESELGRVVEEVVIPRGHFGVAWSRQVVPMVDDAFFTEVPSPT